MFGLKLLEIWSPFAEWDGTFRERITDHVSLYQELIVALELKDAAIYMRVDAFALLYWSL